MAQAAVRHLKLVENETATQDVARPVEDRWSPRATMLFVLGTSAALWSGILIAVWAVL